MARCGDDLYDSNMPATGTIRSYGLFGESGELPDVLHCETIAARSVLHGWELAPHRHARLHQLLLLRRGAGHARLEGGSIALRPRSLVNVPRGEVHAFSFAPGTDGWVVTLPAELLDDLLARSGDERARLARACVVDADADLARAATRLAAEYGGRAAARALVLRGLAATLLGLAARRIGATAATPPDDGSWTGSNVLRRFESLLEAHFDQHWSVARYARELSVTPTHLSRLTRASTGQGASRVVAERVMREARRHLAFSTLPVKTIGYALGYADPAHFCRAFARSAGCSPQAFRRRLG
jgi:AraC family transcriptional activator of pobA